MALPAHEDMVLNILAVYDRASEAQRQAGEAWYPTAGDIVTAIADASGTPTLRVAYALAALSPRNPWKWNVADAYSFAVAKRNGYSMPAATTFGRNQLAAWQALDGDGEPWLTSAPKVKAFVRAILGDYDSVVVDVWAMRVATEGRLDTVRSDAEYIEVAAAYSEAANRRHHVYPASMQAITWLVGQTEGLGSRRVGRHDKVVKRGTAAFIVTLLTGQQAFGL